MDDVQDYSRPPPLPERQPPPPRRPGMGLWFLQSCLVAGCATIVVPFALIFGFFGLVYFLAADSVRENSSALETISAFSNLRERVVRPGASGAGVIAVVAIHGAVDGDGSPLEGDGMLARATEELRNAAGDDRVKAVLLQIDSPGGGLTASDLIHNEIGKVRAAGKPVVAWGGDTMASGGYYIAAACDGIMASPTCTVGSIGVLLQHFQVAELMAKLGVKADPVVSGEHKTMGTPFREMTSEERKILQDYIDIAHSRFVDIVAEGRGMPRTQAEMLADGSIFAPRFALDRGLVDRIGYVEDAVAWLEEIVGEEDMRIVAYRRMMTLNDIFREAGRGVTSAVAGESPRAMAVWK